MKKLKRVTSALCASIFVFEGAQMVFSIPNYLFVLGFLAAGISGALAFDSLLIGGVILALFASCYCLVPVWILALVVAILNFVFYSKE